VPASLRVASHTVRAYGRPSAALRVATPARPPLGAVVSTDLGYRRIGLAHAREGAAGSRGGATLSGASGANRSDERTPLLLGPDGYWEQAFVVKGAEPREASA